MKLIDFGSTKRFQGNEHGVYGGISYFLAPEVIEKNYSQKCDVWSCGVILYMLLSGEPPFDGATDFEVVQRIKNGKFDLDSEIWSHMSKEVKDLISRMLTREKTRLSAKEALQHPWFAKCEKMEGAESAEKQHLIEKALYNLTQFSTRNKLKQHALGYLIQHFMQVSESEELEQVFQALDTSGEGFLSK